MPSSSYSNIVKYYMIIHRMDRLASEFHLLFSFMFYSFRDLNADTFFNIFDLFVFSFLSETVFREF